MRWKLLLGLLASFAIAALGAGPVTAAADTVTFQNEEQETLEKGNFLYSEGLFNFTPSIGGEGFCEFSMRGEVVYEESGAARIDSVETETPQPICGQYGPWPLEMDIDVPEGISFFANGSGEMPIVFDQTIHLSKSKMFCHGEGILTMQWPASWDTFALSGYIPTEATEGPLGCPALDIYTTGLGLQLSEQWGEATDEVKPVSVP